MITPRLTGLLAILLASFAALPQHTSAQSYRDNYRSRSQDSQESIDQMLFENRSLFVRYMTPDQRNSYKQVNKKIERGNYLIELGERTRNVDQRRLRPGETSQTYIDKGDAFIAEGEELLAQARKAVLILVRPLKDQITNRYTATMASSNLADAINSQATDILAELKSRHYMRLLIDKAVVTVGDETHASRELRAPYRNRLINQDGKDYRVFEARKLAIGGSPEPAFSYTGSDEVKVASALILVELMADASSNTAVLTSYGVDLDNWKTVASRLTFVQLDDEERERLGIPAIPNLEENMDPRELRRLRYLKAREYPPPHKDAESWGIIDETLLLEKLVQLPQPYLMEVEAPQLEKQFQRQVMERLIKQALAGAGEFPLSVESLIMRVYDYDGETNELGYSNRTTGVIRLNAEIDSRGLIRDMRLIAMIANSPEEHDVGPLTFNYPEGMDRRRR